MRLQTQIQAHSKEPAYIGKTVKKYGPLYLMLVPAVVLVFIFNYLPLPGLAISFMDYDYFKGFSSPWSGLKNCMDIFRIPDFTQAIINTLQISILNLIIITPLPLIFALLLNEIKSKNVKRFTQTVSYLPYFLSWIAIIGIANTCYSEYGLVNDLRVLLMGAGTKRELFLGMQSLFVPNVILLTVWKELGWGAVIYLAAISGVDASLYEAAIIDGAGKLKQCIYITIPTIMPTFIMLFVLKIGTVFQSNFDLIYGLQNVFINYEVISTVVYKQGIVAGNYAISTAFGFMQGVISLILVLMANYLSKKMNDVSIV